MVIRVQHHANVSKQTTLLDGVDVCPSKWRACGRGFKSMNDVSNVKLKVHLKTRSGNVNIFFLYAQLIYYMKSLILISKLDDVKIRFLIWTTTRNVL